MPAPVQDLTSGLSDLTLGKIPEDQIDDALYFARTGDDDELLAILTPLLQPKPTSTALNGTTNESEKAVLDILTARIIDQSTQNTMLHMAAANNHLDTMKALFSLLPTAPSATPRPQDPFSDPLLPRDVCNSSALPAEATVALANTLNAQQNTPLHYAAMNGALDCAQDLVEHRGGDVYARNAAGRTPCEEADAAGRDEVAAYLAAVGINLDDEDKDDGGADGQGEETSAVDELVVEKGEENGPESGGVKDVKGS